MAQRLAVLLAIASILVVACAAEAPSVEPATTQKYDKKQHNKHEKPDSYDKDNKPDSYKPDSYKPDSYKPDSYKPDSYKPDSYKPDSYKSDSYKPRYKSDSYKHNKHYGDYEQYRESSYNDYYANGAYDDPYAMPPIYDSGYYAGDGGGHQVALFDVILPENLLNGTFIEDLPGDNDGSCNEDNVDGCRADWGLICGLRGPSHYGPRPTPSGKSYGGKVTGPAISGNPVQPVAVGKGFSRGYLSWQTLEEAVNDDSPNADFDLRARSLVIINDNQRAYQVGRLTGAIRFGENIEECHPAFTDNTRVRLRRVPIYLMMAKIAIPTDPATYAAVAPRNQNVRQMTARSSTGSHSCGSDDGTLCGIALVAKGPVNIVVRDDNNQVIRRYTANIEFVTGWSNGDINVPRLNEEEEVRRSLMGYWDAETLDRACLYNDIPLVRPGSLRIDFVRELEVAPQS